MQEAERRIGAYELDIYALDRTNNAIVIIENQLNDTDHTHLGQLITYAAGLDAKVIVWIATKVRDEHRAAIDWLNRLAGDSVSFFLLRLKVLRIGDSKPAVQFDLEANPSQFRQTIRAATSKAPSNSPLSIIWSDDPDAEVAVSSWRALFILVLQRAFDNGLAPQTFGLRAAPTGASTDTFQAPKPFTIGGQEVWVDVHGSADLIRSKVNRLLEAMHLSLSVNCADGTVVTLPPSPSSSPALSRVSPAAVNQTPVPKPTQQASTSALRMPVRAVPSKVTFSTPSKITWSDNPSQPLHINTWRGVYIAAIQRALNQGHSLQQLPIKATTSELVASHYQAAHLTSQNKQRIWVEVHGSADALKNKLSRLLTTMGLSLKITYRDSTSITLPSGLVTSSGRTEPQNDTRSEAE